MGNEISSAVDHARRACGAPRNPCARPRDRNDITEDELMDHNDDVEMSSTAPPLVHHGARRPVSEPTPSVFSTLLLSVSPTSTLSSRSSSSAPPARWNQFRPSPLHDDDDGDSDFTVGGGGPSPQRAKRSLSLSAKPRLVETPPSSASSGAENADCPICLDPLSEFAVGTPRHRKRLLYFCNECRSATAAHAACADKWLRTGGRCIICRKNCKYL